MKLIDARLCVQCDEVLEATTEGCPSCTNKVLFPLTRIIAPIQDRKEIDLTRTMQKAMEP